MKRFIQLLVVAIVGTTGNIYAQSGIYAGDALRFSRTDYGSSARFKGLGNAQISLGGDISSIGGNPAGLGMFTHSEFSITPEFNSINANASYLGNQLKTTKNQLNLNQAAAVWYNPVVKAKGSDLNKGLLSVVWGIGYNRNNDYYGNFDYAASNGTSSIADQFSQQATYQNARPANLSGLSARAFDGYLIDENTTNNTFYLSNTSLPNSQYQSEIRQGSTSELNFAAGMNFSNKFYLGGSIGFVDVRYTSDKLYTENGTTILNIAPTATGEQVPAQGETYDAAYRTFQSTTGSGVNLKIGAIYKPVNELRIGATFTSPSWIHIEDQYSEVLDVNYSGGVNYQSDVITSDLNYNMRTPYKGSVGASYVIGKNALITADVDYVDYATTRLSVSDGYRDVINDNNDYIKQNYTSAINYRVGGEYRIENLTLRAGYGLNGTPYKEDPNNDSQVKYYSGGIGYRFSAFYIDAAYQRTSTNNTFSSYILDDANGNAVEPVANVKTVRNNVFLTLGVKF